MRRATRHSGLILLDAVVGMSILGVLLGALAVAMAHQRNTASRLETQRRLDRLVEGVLTDLQRGEKPAVPAWDVQPQPVYAVEQLTGPGPRDGWVWVDVSATFEKFHADAVGAVPAGSLKWTGGEP